MKVVFQTFVYANNIRYINCYTILTSTVIRKNVPRTVPKIFNASNNCEYDRDGWCVDDGWTAGSGRLISRLGPISRRVTSMSISVLGEVSLAIGKMFGRSKSPITQSFRSVDYQVKIYCCNTVYIYAPYMTNFNACRVIGWRMRKNCITNVNLVKAYT